MYTVQARFVRMDLLQLTNTCGLQDGKSFNPHRNFNGKRPVVLKLNNKLLSGKNRAPYSRPHAQALL